MRKPNTLIFVAAVLLVGCWTYYTRCSWTEESSAQASSQHSVRRWQSQGKRPESIIAFFAGDEGSTVLSAAFMYHPQVYSPDWGGYEPVDYRHWKNRKFTTQAQLEAIRFLLQLSTMMNPYDIGVKTPLYQSDYEEVVGNADAIFMKARVCRSVFRDLDEWMQCMESVISNLVCGDKDDTVDHLVLPVRYGFDRVCSTYVHGNKTLYRQVSQWAVKSSNDDTPQLEIIEKVLVKKIMDQQNYIEEFMLLNGLARSACPGGTYPKTQVHIYDYDNAKKVGLKSAFRKIFNEVGLAHDKVNLGEFAGRKPGNYCEKVFDKKSGQILQQKQFEYELWLNNTCDIVDETRHPWCTNENVT